MAVQLMTENLLIFVDKNAQQRYSHTLNEIS
jgi:hypothetical protein